MTWSEAIHLFAPAILAAIATIATTWWGNRTAEKNRNKTWYYEHLDRSRKEKLEKLRELEQKQPTLDDARESFYVDLHTNPDKAKMVMLKKQIWLEKEEKLPSWERYMEVTDIIHDEEIEKHYKTVLRDWPKVRNVKAADLNEEIKKIDEEMARFHK